MRRFTSERAGTRVLVPIYGSLQKKGKITSLIQSVESSVDTMISSANPCIGVVCYKHKNIILVKISF
jgi:hypothetical protein